MGLHQTEKKNCTAKEMINKIKRTHIELGKISVNHISYITYKELIQLNIKKINYSIFKIVIFPKKTYRWPAST